MSASNSKEYPTSHTGTMASGSTSTIKRPMNPILAPSKFSFGSTASNDSSNSSSSLNLAPSKLAFRGLTASKLSSVTQTVCSNSKSEESNSKPTEESNKDRSSTSKPSFIPLTKEPSNIGETVPSVPITPITKGLASPETAKEAEPIPKEKETVTKTSKEASAKSSASFVFGENLTDRAANFSNGTKTNESADEDKEVEDEAENHSNNAEASNSTQTETEKVSKSKSLTESAAEYCETRNKKPVEFTEVELITGEESEANVCQMNAKLYLFDKTTSSWLERGRGQLRLNDLRPLNSNDSEDNSGPSSRLIMRTAGSLRVILNAKVFPEMTVEKPTEKNIRLTAMGDLNQGLRVFLVSGSPKDIRTLYVALVHRVDNLKQSLSSPNKAESGTAKRKLENDNDSKEETPPPEKEPKVV